MIRVKICGLTTAKMVESVIRLGADRVGFVVVPTSPRAVSLEDAGRFSRLAHNMGAEPWIVAGLGSEGGQAGGAAVENLLRLVEQYPEVGAIQLHGREAPEPFRDFKRRLAGIGAVTRLVKAHGVADAGDLQALAEFDGADAYLLDAKPPMGADREGGFGEVFDWAILKEFDPGKPWVLSGGLTAANVAEAIAISGAGAVDVSSGVESAPGVKDEVKVRAFIEAARGAG